MQLGLGLLTYLSTWALLVDLGDALNRESWGFAEPKDVSSGCQFRDVLIRSDIGP